MTDLPVCWEPGCRRSARYALRDLLLKDLAFACPRHLHELPGLLLEQDDDSEPVCRKCSAAMPVPDRPQGGGRTKLYCSPRCRTAAHRTRAAWPGDTLRGALGTERA